MSADAPSELHAPGWLRVFDPAEPRRLHYVIHGGRGGGKSWALAMLGVDTALRQPGARIACVRETLLSLNDSSRETLRAVINAGGWADAFDVQQGQILCDNGSRFSFHGLSESTGTARRFKSTEGIDLTLVEEAQDVTERSLELLTPTVIGRRPGARIIYAINPTNADDAVYQRFLANTDPNALTIPVSWRDNPLWDPGAEAERLAYLRLKPNQYPHIYDGELRVEVEGAMWSRAMVVAARVDSLPLGVNGKPVDPDEVVVAIDPAGTRGSRSDYTAMVVMARVNDEGYVLASERMKAVPAEWGRRAVALHDRYGASRIVVEVSGAGADSLLHTVRQADESVYVEGVSPSGLGSKWERASPFGTLTEAGKLHLVGSHPDLESEMTAFTQDSLRDDLVDAMVWGGRAMRLELAATRVLENWTF